MEPLLDQLKILVHHYGYLAVAAAIFFEDFGVPLPGETLLISAALLASQGELHIVPLLLSAWAGAVLGDNVGYAVGRFGGRRVVLRYGHFLFISRARLERAEGFFKRHGGPVVVMARFFEVLRQLNGLVAGIVKMPWSRFLPYNALGAALWVCFWGILFYQAGNKAAFIIQLFRKLEVSIIITLAVAAATVVFYLLYKKYPRHRAGK